MRVENPNQPHAVSAGPPIFAHFTAQKLSSTLDQLNGGRFVPLSEVIFVILPRLHWKRLKASIKESISKLNTGSRCTALDVIQQKIAT